MNKRTFLLGLILTFLAVSVFPRCSPFERDESIVVAGSWKTDWEEWVITDTSIEYAGIYKADIVKFDNRHLNSGDTAIYRGGTEIDVGYAVIQFTEVADAGTGALGKYQIFRWGTNEEDPSQRDFTQGYKNVGPDYPGNVNEVFDSIAAAEEGATIGTGHFNDGSVGAIRQ